MAALTKQAVDIFGRWMTWQRVYQHRDIPAFQQYLDAAYWNHLASECAQDQYLSSQLCKLFDLDSENRFDQQSHFIEDANAVLGKLYESIESDFIEFIDYLGSHHFSDPDVNEYQKADQVVNVIKRDVDFLNTIFYHHDNFVRSEYLFSVANKTFEFCFSENTYPVFLRMLHEERYYPLTRLLQSILWQFLSAEGWRDWSAEALKKLQKESESGKTIVYVAGGADIYSLLASGIYNIEVIDPLLPSQATNYYSEGWSWLVEEGEIGDVLHVNNRITLHRKMHEVFRPFEAVTASNETVTITHTETTWSVYHLQLKKVVGSIVYKRRFSVQNDFIADPAKALLLSFNELYLLGAPPHCGGWGINTAVIPNSMPIFVKQLHNPITAMTLKKLTNANDVPFKFVNLGGCAT